MSDRPNASPHPALPRPAPTELIAAHAAGALSPGQSLLMATHLALCPEARAIARRMETLGGVLLETIEPEPVTDDALDRILARLDETPGTEEPPPTPHNPDPRLPATLGSFLPAALEGLRWRRVLPGLARYPIDVGDGSVDVELLRLAPGRAVPRHGHRGLELVLVLTGACEDGHDTWHRGEVAIGDRELEHGMRALPGEVCHGLVVVEGGIKPPGLAGRLFDRMHGRH